MHFESSLTLHSWVLWCFFFFLSKAPNALCSLVNQGTGTGTTGLGQCWSSSNILTPLLWRLRISFIGWSYIIDIDAPPKWIWRCIYINDLLGCEQISMFLLFLVFSTLGVVFLTFLSQVSRCICGLFRPFSWFLVHFCSWPNLWSKTNAIHY